MGERWHVRVLGTVLVIIAAGVIGVAALLVGALASLAVSR
jgi:hypothetical protein